jgi:hypothetical protein
MRYPLGAVIGTFVSVFVLLFIVPPLILIPMGIVIGAIAGWIYEGRKMEEERMYLEQEEQEHYNEDYKDGEDY